MRNLFVRVIGMLFLVGLMGWPSILWAHGIVGKRFFPASILVEDPFPADELALAVESISEEHGDELAVEAEFQKRITDRLSLSVEGEYERLDEDHGTHKGFNNPEFGLTYSVFRSPEHEWIASVGLGISPGGVGDEEIGADEMTRITPSFLFGKGLGDLPEGMALMSPLAVTGRLGLEAPWGRSDRAEELGTTLSMGLVIEYSIPYLQSFVRDVGIPRPFNRLVPIIEITMDRSLSGPEAHKATGFWAPGLLWAGKSVELGLELLIPMNDRTADGIGFVGLVHFFLDDLSPGVFGRPLFSSETARP